MEHLPVFYTILFNAITDAIIALDHMTPMLQNVSF